MHNMIPTFNSYPGGCVRSVSRSFDGSLLGDIFQQRMHTEQVPRVDASCIMFFLHGEREQIFRSLSGSRVITEKLPRNVLKKAKK